MSSELLRTKLFVPKIRPLLVPRPRLIEKLNQGVQQSCKLTLISAPAGFGKTTLIVEWGMQLVESATHPKSALRNPQLCWLSLDKGDNDLTRFLTYLVAALQTIDSSVGKGTLAALQSPGAVNVEGILTTLLNEITNFPDDVILILDDYHVIESPPVDRAVTFLLDYLPTNLYLAITTRIDPPLPLSRLRGRGQLTELRTADLRFTREETAVFLNRVMGLALSAEDVAALETRTEGWIVGLQLAALSIQKREGISEFIRSFSGSHHHILDYLVEEVLSQQSPSTQSFLLQTSILERMTGPLCDAVCSDRIDGTSQGTAQETLEQLASSNLFIIPLDDERRWYRYHHLFADLLLARLKRLHPELMTNLHLRAADWFEKNGLITEAVSHAFSAKNYDRAASLIEQAASGTMLHGRLNIILRWLDALPKKMLEARPRLRLCQAHSLAIAGYPKVADKILLDAKSSFENLPRTSENMALRGELAAIRTGIIIYHNDPNEIIQEAEEALTYLPEDSLIYRARVYMALGTAYAYIDDWQMARDTYQQGRDLALSANNPFLATANIELLVEPQVYHQGCLQDAAQNLAQILELGLMADGTHQTFTGAAHVLLGEIHLEWNNLELASQYMKKGVELLQEGGIGYTLTHCYCAKARFKLALGEIDHAIEDLQAATKAAQSSPLMQFQMRNLACQVKSALYLGDTNTALQWAMGEKCELPEKLPSHLHETQQISLARVYLAQGNFKKTIETLNRIHPQAESFGRMAHLIDIYLVKALAYQEQDELAAAIECLEHALSLGEPEGYVQTFVEQGEPMARLLQEVSERGIAPAYVGRLLTAVSTPIQSAPPKPGDSTSPLMEPLTERELEVLHLMTEGLTYNEIACQITVSLNTVRTHVKNIYSKLGIHKRSQAIAKARELKLF
jgi:LuxR family maltose regulon positive regulatory protein